MGAEVGSAAQVLAGRVALVTGGGHGLGRATVHELARCGAHVLVADVDAESAEQVAKEVTEAVAEAVAEPGAAGGPQGSAQAVALDVTDPAQCDRVVAEAAAAHGAAFDLLVNNAGTDRGADLVDVEDDQWHGVMAVNVHGPMYLSRAFVRHACAVRDADGPPADVVNIVSISALTVGAGAGAYNSSKAALLKLTEVMQTEARERSWPVRVTAVNPAAMDTPMMEQWGLPQHRMMPPSVVAGLVRTAATLPPEVVLQSLVVTTRVETYPR